MGKAAPGGGSNSFVAQQLSEFIMNCQNSHIVMISESDPEKYEERFIERDNKLRN
jgi:2-phosphoglycerate kinase